MENNVNPEPANNEARRRLISSALKLFAEKGFKATSTREICAAAAINISAICYYFGDKAGLYRAVFTESLAETKPETSITPYLELPLTQALQQFFSNFLEPLKKGEEIRLVMKLHFREMVEPTGIRQQDIDCETKPHYEILIAILKKHLQLSEINTDMQRLAFSLIGMAIYFYVAQDVVATIAPALLNTENAVDVLAERLAGYAVAMIATEAQRIGLA